MYWYVINGKSERILTKLGAYVPEYICERTKFRYILSSSGVIHLRISTTKYNVFNTE